MLRSCKGFQMVKLSCLDKQGRHSLRAQQLPPELTFHHLQTELSECCYLAVKVAANSFLRPRKMKEICPPLFLWITDHICHDLNTRNTSTGRISGTGKPTICIKIQRSHKRVFSSLESALNWTY